MRIVALATSCLLLSKFVRRSVVLIMYCMKKVKWAALVSAAGLSFACVGPESGAGPPEWLPSCPQGQQSEWVETSVFFEDFREGVIWESAKPININGKVVVYQNLLFVLEPFDGVHVFDNTNIESPRALGFLVVPGNSDIVVKDDVLYLDSYTDLVKVGVADGRAVELGRIKLAFGKAYLHDEEKIITGGGYECQER